MSLHRKEELIAAWCSRIIKVNQWISTMLNPIKCVTYFRIYEKESFRKTILLTTLADLLPVDQLFGVYKRRNHLRKAPYRIQFATVKYSRKSFNVWHLLVQSFEKLSFFSEIGKQMQSEDSSSNFLVLSLVWNDMLIL